MNLKVINSKTTPQFRVHFLSVGDADAIVIAYRQSQEDDWCIALIDAGNVSNGDTIKDFLNDTYGTTKIDLAVCSHPDKDHKGGFFTLLQDEEVEITEFWWKNPYYSIEDDDFTRMKKKTSKRNACEACYNHPDDSSLNMLDLARHKCESKKNVRVGKEHDIIPIRVLGPSDDLYREAAIGIVQDFAELKDNPNLAQYDEAAKVTEDSARSTINEKTDPSYTNMASIVLLFQPTKHFKLLLCGDASENSLREIVDNNKDLLKGCFRKVPHHGSIHNLNTDIIDDLQPKISVICASGNEKHPNKNLVYYLSKYGDVYSTHKTINGYFSSEGVKDKAIPLKKKIEK